MKKNLTDFVVAIIVIICSIVLVLALAFTLGGRRSGKNDRTVEIDFPDITGIHLHSEVRYAGAPAGSITAVRLLTFKERLQTETAVQQRNAVRVTVTLRPEVPPLPADVRTTIGSDTLLSDKFVALTAGTPAGPPLAAGAVEAHEAKARTRHLHRWRRPTRLAQHAQRQHPRAQQCQRSPVGEGHLVGLHQQGRHFDESKQPGLISFGHGRALDTSVRLVSMEPSVTLVSSLSSRSRMLGVCA